jgi:hypothetical protein
VTEAKKRLQEVGEKEEREKLYVERERKLKINVA